jgi:hypothetical protein
VLSSEELPMVPDDDNERDEDQALRESWTPRHAYGR